MACNQITLFRRIKTRGIWLELTFLLTRIVFLYIRRHRQREKLFSFFCAWKSFFPFKMKLLRLEIPTCCKDFMGISFCFIMFHDNNPSSEIKFRSTMSNSSSKRLAPAPVTWAQPLSTDFKFVQRTPPAPRVAPFSKWNRFIHSSLKSDYKRQWLNKMLPESSINFWRNGKLQCLWRIVRMSKENSQQKAKIAHT